MSTRILTPQTAARILALIARNGDFKVSKLELEFREDYACDSFANVTVDVYESGFVEIDATEYQGFGERIRSERYNTIEEFCAAYTADQEPEVVKKPIKAPKLEATGDEAIVNEMQKWAHEWKIAALQDAWMDLEVTIKRCIANVIPAYTGKERDVLEEAAVLCFELSHKYGMTPTCVALQEACGLIRTRLRRGSLGVALSYIERPGFVPAGLET